MIEPEIAFADIIENMDVAEHYVRFVLKYTIEKCPSELEYLEVYEKEEMARRKKEEEEEAKAQQEKDKAEGKVEAKEKGGKKKQTSTLDGIFFNLAPYFVP